MSAVTNRLSGEAVVGQTVSKRLDIQGLRALAVLVVVLNHLHVPGFLAGYVGVDVFFVISGYVITHMLLRDGARRGGTIGFLNFYAKRARRIVPSATLIIVVTIIAIFELTSFLRGARLLPDATASSLFLANTHFIATGTEYADAGSGPSPLQHYWSLAIEEQFYLAWPLVMALTMLVVAKGAGFAKSERFAGAGGLTKLGRFTNGAGFTLRPTLLAVLVTVAAASYIHSIVLTSSNLTAAYYSPLTRFWELMLGCILAVAEPYIARRLSPTVATIVGWAGFVAVAAAGAKMPYNMFPGWDAAVPALRAAAIIVAGLAPSKASPSFILSMRLPRYVGDISYSLYLVHWPIMAVVAARYGHDFSVLTKIVLFLGSFLGAMVLYHAFEDPIRRSRFLETRPWAGLAIIPACIAIVFAVAAFERHRWAIDVPLVQNLF